MIRTISQLLVFSLFFLPCLASAQGTLRGGGINGLVYNSSSSDGDYIDHLQSEGATAVRLFFDNPDAETATEAEYRDWFENTVLPRMDQLLDEFINTRGMKVLLSIHTPPGGRSNGARPVDAALVPGVDNEWRRDLLVEIWTTIATNHNSYGDNLMYQIFSEPAPPSDDSAWLQLQERLINAIRDAGSVPEDQQPRIFYMNPFGDPRKAKSINLAAARGKMGILANMYYPFLYTHQGIQGSKKKKVKRYPTCLPPNKKVTKKNRKKARRCSRKGLKKILKKLVKFAKKNNLEMAMPEVAVSRHAPGAERWLRDAFTNMAKLNIGWFYFTFTERGNSAWRLDCTDDSGDICTPLPVGQASSRQAVVEEFM